MANAKTKSTQSAKSNADHNAKNHVQFRGVTKAYGSVTVIPDLNIDIKEGEFIVLVGPSGCGKTTTLRMLAGLESVSGGEILINEKIVSDLQPGERNCAMVFQNYALYPHMSVKDNIGYAMKVHKVDPAEREKRVNEAADILGLQPYLDRKPKNLSGGQRQRVAIGRALVRQPEVFLFDEPLSNLDAKLRVEMRTEIKLLQKRLGTTAVYVTHDQVEAMTMADRVVVMRDGHVEQFDNPIALYEKPVNRFVANFIGSPAMNFFDAEIAGDKVNVQGQALDLPIPSSKLTKTKNVILGIRPEHMNSGPKANKIEFDVRAIEPLGAHTLLLGKLGEMNLTAQVESGFKAEAGKKVTINPDMTKAHLFDPKTEMRIVAE